MSGDRQFVPSNNPLSAVQAWEISPCLEFLHPSSDESDIEAFETVAEAEAQSDEAQGPLFWGVYARLTDEAVSQGHDPAIHLRDFECYADALQFVEILNGKESA